MPKNKGKGGKNRRRGKNENEDMKRELVTAEPGQAYAQVIKMLGNGRLEAMCFDNVKRLCHIRGKLRKKVWINTSDIILIGLRDFQDEKADVILKYTPDEARALKNKGCIPEHGIYFSTTTNIYANQSYLFLVNISDTTQFGVDPREEDIFFEENFSDDSDEAGTSGDKASNNWNRNQNSGKDMLDITDEEDEDSYDEEE